MNPNAGFLRGRPPVPRELSQRRNVTSPGGTTEAAINTLNEGDVNDKVVEALGRARQREREIANEFGPR